MGSKVQNQNVLDYVAAAEALADRWVAACGGTERPTRSRSGRVYLYVYNFAERRHAWLDVETDMLRFDDPNNEEV